MEVLDHGYIVEVESWGSDERIVEAARMSTGKGFLGWGPKHKSDCPNASNIYDCNCAEPGDEKLLRYLWENKHHTPFEMAGLTVEVQAPIFVFREWHRHRVPFSYNEASSRYEPLPNLNYVPTVERLMLNSKTNKQAGTIKGAQELTESAADGVRAMLTQSYEQAEVDYQRFLNMGVPKELARVHLPVGRYSKMRASSNLRGWLAFIELRAHTAAQYEIRVYAEALVELLRKRFPRTLKLARPQ